MPIASKYAKAPSSKGAKVRVDHIVIQAEIGVYFLPHLEVGI